MHIVLENAGARSGFLIFDRKGTLMIEAEGTYRDEENIVVCREKMSECAGLSHGVVNYAYRTMKTVLLQNAAEEGNFINDPYVNENKSKSIVCIPLIEKQKVKALLYLENDLYPGVFTIQKLALLKLLTGQITISIENAALYSNMENLVDERTHPLVKTNEELEKANREKEILMKEVLHRVKNNFQVLSGLMTLQSQYARDEFHRNLFETSVQRINSMARINEKLYKSDSLIQINYSEYISEIIHELVDSYSLKSDNITLKMDIGNINLEISKAIPCSLIINELISNSLGHAFPGGRAGTITVTLHAADNVCRLSVSDDGTGLPDGFDFTKLDSLGIQLVNALTLQLKGSFEVSDNNGVGAKFSVSFPLS